MESLVDFFFFKKILLIQRMSTVWDSLMRYCHATMHVGLSHFTVTEQKPDRFSGRTFYRHIYQKGSKAFERFCSATYMVMDTEVSPFIFCFQTNQGDDSMLASTEPELKVTPRFHLQLTSNRRQKSNTS